MTVAVLVSAVTTVLQTTLRSSASASSGSASGTAAAEQVNQGIAATLSAKEKILVQLKAMRKKWSTSLAGTTASSGHAGDHTANFDKNAADRLVPLSSFAADATLLTDAAPGGFDPYPQFTGFVPKLLSVAHAFCVDAEQTAWGHVIRERGPQAHCDG